MKWARDGFLSEEFDIVIMIPLRVVQQQSLENAIIEQIGKDAYLQLKDELGKKSLIILEGLDEMKAEERQRDPLLHQLGLLNSPRQTLLDAKLLVTSRPYACQKLKAARKFEIVGFNEQKLKEYIKNLFPNDAQSARGILQQLREYPNIQSLCYVPLSARIILEYFQYQGGSLPSTITELYQAFIVKRLQNHLEKVIQQPTTLASLNSSKNLLLEILPDIPEEAIGVVLLLSKLSFHAFFDWFDVIEKEDQYCRKILHKQPQIVFKEEDLVTAGITLPKNSDGFGFLKSTKIYHFTKTTNVYAFIHLSVQEFLCALHLAVSLSKVEQSRILHKHFFDFPNIIIHLCGITNLRIPNSVQFLLEQIKGKNNECVVNAAKCLYESQRKCVQEISPLTVSISGVILSPYDLMTISHLVYHYPVATLTMRKCNLGNKELKLLAHCTSEAKNCQLEELDISVNCFSAAGLVHVLRIMTSKNKFLIVRKSICMFL